MERTEGRADCTGGGQAVDADPEETSWGQFSTCLEILLHMEATEIYAQTRKAKEKYKQTYMHIFIKHRFIYHIITQTC